MVANDQRVETRADARRCTGARARRPSESGERTGKVVNAKYVGSDEESFAWHPVVLSVAGPPRGLSPGSTGSATRLPASEPPAIWLQAPFTSSALSPPHVP
eukprot:6199182-Pleurochrysis_carterae.AAC.1